MTTSARVPDDRQPARHATYPGDVTHIVTDGAKGPTTFGEAVYPVTADYDPETNKTRVGFSYLTPPTEGASA